MKSMTAIFGKIMGAYTALHHWNSGAGLNTESPIPCSPASASVAKESLRRMRQADKQAHCLINLKTQHLFASQQMPLHPLLLNNALVKGCQQTTCGIT